MATTTTIEPNLYNPIGWAHLQLRGGGRTTVATTMGYTLIMTALIFATVRYNPERSSRILSAWTFGLLGLQAGILLIFGCVTVGTAVRLDHTSKMIESHRLMPTSAFSAILGYIFGASSQAMAMALANFAIGAIVASNAQVAFRRWAMANAILLGFCVFVWVFVVFFGFVAQSAFRWIASVLAIAFWMSQGFLIRLLPAVTILASPAIGNSIFAMRSRTTDLSWEYIASFVAQLLVAGICFLGATRKYRRADAQSLGSGLGLLLLGSWIALSLLGILRWEDFRPMWLPEDSGDDRRILATMVATLFVMIVPISAAARASVRWKQHVEVHDVVLPRRPVSPLLVALVSASLPLLLTLTFDLPQPLMIDGTIRTAIVFASFALTLSCMLRMLPLGKKSVWVIPTAWILLTFAGPIFIDLLYHSLLEGTRENTGILSTLSPPAALWDIWSINPIGTNLGLAIQVAQAIVVMIVFYFTTSRSASRPSPTPLSLPAN